MCEDCLTEGKVFKPVHDLDTHRWDVHGVPYPGLPVWKCENLGCSSTTTVWARIWDLRQHRYMSHGKDRTTYPDPRFMVDYDPAVHTLVSSDMNELPLENATGLVGSTQGLSLLHEGAKDSVPWTPSQSAQSMRAMYEPAKHNRVVPSNSESCRVTNLPQPINRDERDWFTCVATSLSSLPSRTQPMDTYISPLKPAISPMAEHQACMPGRTRKSYQPRKPLKDKDWNANKAAITRFWIEEEEDLENLIRIMRERGFDASKAQYKLKFKQWGLTKRRFWCRTARTNIETIAIQPSEDAQRLDTLATAAASEISQRNLFVMQQRSVDPLQYIRRIEDAEETLNMMRDRLTSFKDPLKAAHGNGYFRHNDMEMIDALEQILPQVTLMKAVRKSP